MDLSFTVIAGAKRFFATAGVTNIETENTKRWTVLNNNFIVTPHNS